MCEKGRILLLIIFLHQKCVNFDSYFFVKIYVWYQYSIKKCVRSKWVSHFCHNWCSTRPTTSDMSHNVRKQIFSAFQQCAICLGLDQLMRSWWEEMKDFWIDRSPTGLDRTLRDMSYLLHEIIQCLRISQFELDHIYK